MSISVPGQRRTSPRRGSAEHRRLAESPGSADPWRLWGPYISGRQWGTVREDYSANGDAWNYLPFEQAHARAYRWGEDGIAGICDRFGFLNLALAMWNGNDDRLKERFFGVANGQGNHGEDVKEYWWPTDATPTHSFAELVYRYPHAAYPYQELLEENARRGRDQDEYELSDTGVLAQDRFFDVRITHAKAAPDDICMRITATNYGPDPAAMHLLPQLWFRNTWAWGRDERMPQLQRLDPPELAAGGLRAVRAEHGYLGRYFLLAQGDPQIMVCDNETDTVGIFHAGQNRSAYPKNGIGRAVVAADRSAVNPAGTGTKAALWYRFEAVPPGESVRVDLRLCADLQPDAAFGPGFERVLADRGAEAQEFYAQVIPAQTSEVDALTARRAFAGLLWGRQLYRYDVPTWLAGDPGQPDPSPQRAAREPLGRNTSWRHLALADVISMPDDWEYPWFAAWDLAFHAVTLAHVDPTFAKEQLVLICREWAMHPNGQLPAYEWAFSDVNPPVHAWAAWTVYAIDGSRDHDFLIRVFSKLLLNFAWWVNRKDADDSGLFEGGFLGMDNVGLFDRSAPLPSGYRLEQSDATSWMAFYCLSMLRIALELARVDQAWDEVATKFLEHFLAISHAADSFGSTGCTLWDDQDGFCYDVLVAADGSWEQLRVRSMVGLLPLLAVGVSPAWVDVELPDYTARLRWLQRRRPDLTRPLITGQDSGIGLTLSMLDPGRYLRVLHRMLDEDEFLSPHGIRSLSAAYRDPYTTTVDGMSMSIRYAPAESDSALFGGNSNWRGPVWMPVNALLADAIRTYAQGLGSGAGVPMPSGSGQPRPLARIADELDDRLLALFRPGPDGRRPSAPRDHGAGPLWDHPTFSEYFHGDTGRGLGASHQTGWTALVAHLVCARGMQD